MGAANYNFKIEQGATFILTLTLKDETGVVRNLTGYSARMQARPTIESTTKILDLTSTPPAGITITELTGVIAILISATVTTALSFDRAVYDLEIQSGAGVVERILEGNITFNKEVTR